MRGSIVLSLALEEGFTGSSVNISWISPGFIIALREMFDHQNIKQSMKLSKIQTVNEIIKNSNSQWNYQKFKQNFKWPKVSSFVEWVTYALNIKLEDCIIFIVFLWVNMSFSFWKSLLTELSKPYTFSGAKMHENIEQRSF